MTDTLHATLARELVGTPLKAAFSLRANEALEIDSSVEPGSPAARGLARSLASNAEAARYLAHRPALLDEIANAPPDDLKRRAERLPAALEEEDLEAACELVLEGLHRSSLLAKDKSPDGVTYGDMLRDMLKEFSS